MKRNRVPALLMIVLLCLTSGLALAQEAPAGMAPPAAPTQALMPCPAEVTAATICDRMATQADDLVGVWSVYFMAEPAFLRFNADGTWLIGDTVESTRATSVEGYPSGIYSFDEAGVFTSFDPNTPVAIMPEECRAGHYLVRVIQVGGQPVALNHAVLDDCFVPRRTDWAYDMLWAGAE